MDGRAVGVPVLVEDDPPQAASATTSSVRKDKNTKRNFPVTLDLYFCPEEVRLTISLLLRNEKIDALLRAHLDLSFPAWKFRGERKNAQEERYALPKWVPALTRKDVCVHNASTWMPQN